MLCEEQASRFQPGIRLSDGVPYILLVEARAGDGEGAGKSMWIKSPGNLHAPRDHNRIMEVRVQTHPNEKRLQKLIGMRVRLKIYRL